MINIPSSEILLTIQALFACTGCDYVSFFVGIGKAKFFKTFFEKTNFISNSSFGTCGLAGSYSTLQELTDHGFLSFIRLVGCAYIKNHKNAFPTLTPESVFHSFDTTPSKQEQHFKWLEHIRQKIWARTASEAEMIPSAGALKRHWQRSCWVLHMWRQAQENEMKIESPIGSGWYNHNGKLAIEWDSDENMRTIRQRVALLLKGCTCKSGCHTNRCTCKKNGTTCSPGCTCINCLNTAIPTLDKMSLDEDEDDNSDYDLGDEIDDIMNAVFGESDIVMEDDYIDEDSDSTEEMNSYYEDMPTQ